MVKNKDLDVSGQDVGVKWIFRILYLIVFIVFIYDIIIGNNGNLEFCWENKSMLDLFTDLTKNLH